MYESSINYNFANDGIAFSNPRKLRIPSYLGKSLKSYSDCSMIECLNESISMLSLDIVDLKKKINEISHCIDGDSFYSIVNLNRLEEKLFEMEELRSIKVSRLNNLINKRVETLS